MTGYQGKKHKFDKEKRCIQCKRTRKEINVQYDLEFLEHLFNCNPNIQDKRSILKNLGFPIKQWEGFITKLENEKKK